METPLDQLPIDRPTRSQPFWKQCIAIAIGAIFFVIPLFDIVPDFEPLGHDIPKRNFFCGNSYLEFHLSRSLSVWSETDFEGFYQGWALDGPQIIQGIPVEWRKLDEQRQRENLKFSRRYR